LPPPKQHRQPSPGGVAPVTSRREHQGTIGPQTRIRSRRQCRVPPKASPDCQTARGHSKQVGEEKTGTRYFETIGGRSASSEKTVKRRKGYHSLGNKGNCLTRLPLRNNEEKWRKQKEKSKTLSSGRSLPEITPPGRVVGKERGE